MIGGSCINVACIPTKTLSASERKNFTSAPNLDFILGMARFIEPHIVEEGKPANFLVLDADSPFEAVRQRADVLGSIRNGEYLFKRPNPSYEVSLDLFRKTR